MTVGSALAPTSLRTQMVEAQRLLRVENRSAVEVSALLGVDQMIIQLWSRLPADLYPDQRAKAVTSDHGRVVQSISAPTTGLRRVLACRVPAVVRSRLRPAQSIA